MRDRQQSKLPRRSARVQGYKVLSRAIASAVVLGSAGAAWAQATYSWTMTSPQSARNWNEGWDLSGGATLPYPQTSGDAVNFISANAGLGNSSLTVNVSDAMVGSLTIGRRLGGGTFILESEAPSNTNTLTFSSPTGLARITTIGEATGGSNLTVPMVVAVGTTELRVNNNAFSGFQLSGTVTATGPNTLLNLAHNNSGNSNGPSTFNVERPVGFGTIRVGPIVSWASLGTLDVNSPLTIDNRNVSTAVNSGIRGTIIRTAFSGAGALTINNVGLGAQVQVTGSGTYTGQVTVNSGAFVANHNSSNVGGNNAAKMGIGASVGLNAATLGLTGSGSAGSTLSVAAINASSGQNTLAVIRSGSNTAALSASVLNRGAGATLWVTRNNDAATASVSAFGVGTAPANGLLGAWAIVSNSSVNSGQWDFVGNSTSFAPATYVAFPGGAGTGTENVTIGGNTTTAGAAINSLRVTGNATLTLNGNLSLTSGGILLASGNFGSANLTIGGTGTLSSGGSELVLHQPPNPNGNSHSLTINAPVNIGSGSLIKTGGGLLTVANLSALEGSRLRIQGGTYRGPIPAVSAVTLSNGGAIDTNGSGSVAITLGTGPGQVEFGAGGGGFSASGAEAGVSINNGVLLTAAQINRHLVLQTNSATHPLILANPLDITGDLALTVGGAGGNAAFGRAYARIVSGIVGDGSLSISGSSVNGMVVLETPNTFSGGVLLSGGQMWAISGEGIQNSTPVQLGYGGVWATRGVMDRRLGTQLGSSDGGIRWLAEGSPSGDGNNVGWGGFAAVGGPLTVALKDRDGNLALLAPIAGGMSSGSPASLSLGSAYSNAPVTVVNNFSSAASIVDIRSFGPAANVVAGNISGTGTVQFGGNGGVLILDGDNTGHTGNLSFVNAAGVILKFADAAAAVGGKSAASNTLNINNNSTFDPNGTDLTTATAGTFRNVTFSNGSGTAGLGNLINSGLTPVRINAAGINAGTNLNFGGPGDIQVLGNVTGSNVLVKRGYGKLVLSGVNTQTNQGMLLSGGSVDFDYTTSAGFKFNGAAPTSANNAGGNLQLVAVDLNLIGGASGNVTQPIGGLQLGQSSGNSAAQSSPVTVNLKANGGDLFVPITRLVRADNQGSVDFSLSTTGSGTPSVTIGTIPVNGVVSSLNLTNGGSGYTSAPTVSFPGLDAGTVAPQATAIVDANGVVTGLVLTKQGTALDPAAPLTVSFAGGGGTGAAATVTVSALPTIGNYATLNKRHFAALSGGVNGSLTTPTYATPAAGVGNALANIDVPAGTTEVTIDPLGSVANSLRFADGSADTTLTISGGALRLNPHAGGILVTPDVGSRNVTVGGQVRWNVNRELFVYNYSTGTVTFSGTVNDVAAGSGLTKVGVGDVVLNGTANVASLRAVGGRLIVRNHASLPTSNIIIGGGTPELSGSDVNGRPTSPTFVYEGAGGNYGGNLSLIGPGVLEVSGATPLVFTATGNNATTNGDAPWDLTIRGTGDLTFSGPVRLGSSTNVASGYGVLTLGGSGTVTLNGTINRALGGWAVNSGTLVLGHVTDTIQDDNPVTVSGGTLSLAGSDTMGSLTLNSGTIAGAGVYRAGYYHLKSGTVSANLSGLLSDLDKSGPGTVVLQGANSYGGFTTVTDGVLDVQGSIDNFSPMSVSGGGSVVVGSSATVDVRRYEQTGGSLQLGGTLDAAETARLNSVALSGSGVLEASLLDIDGGSIEPGGSGTIGALTFNADSVLMGSGNLTLDFASDVSFDTLAAPVAINLGSYGLTLSGLENLVGGSPLTLVTSAALSGEFSLLSPLPGGFSLLYSTTSVVLQTPSAPEPADWTFPGDGLYSDGTNWSTGTSPNGPGASATFNLDIPGTEVATITLDVPVTLGTLVFNSPTDYILSGAPAITMSKPGGAQVAVLGGVHAIETDMVLASSTEFAISAETSLFVSGGVSGGGSLTKTGNGMLEIGGNVTHTGNTTLSGGTTIFSGEVRNPAGVLTVEAGAIGEFAAAPNLAGQDPRVILEQASLAVSGTAVMAFYGSEDNRSAVAQNLAVVDSLSIANDGAPLGSRTYSGFLDLTNNDLIVRGSGSAEQASELAEVRDMARAWYTGNGGLPGTTGLGSSLAFYGSATGFITLAVYNNNPQGNGTPDFTTFDGVTVDAFDILVKYTYLGDTNLDGVVDATDLSRALQGLNGNGTGWNYGDVNYDGTVDTFDLGRIVAALRGQGGPLGNAAIPGGGLGGGIVPEPAGLGLLVAAVPFLSRRRR